MKSDNLFYNKFLSELEEFDLELLTTEEAIDQVDCETIAEVLAEVAGEVVSERLEELFNAIEMEFTTVKGDLQ